MSDDESSSENLLSCPAHDCDRAFLNEEAQKEHVKKFHIGLYNDKDGEEDYVDAADARGQSPIREEFYCSECTDLRFLSDEALSAHKKSKHGRRRNMSREQSMNEISAPVGSPQDKPAFDTKETVSATLAGNAAKSLGLQVRRGAPVPDAKALALTGLRAVQLSSRAPASGHAATFDVTPCRVGLVGRPVVAEMICVPPCTVAYRFVNNGALSVVNMLCNRAVLLPPRRAPIVQLAAASPYVVAYHSDDTLQVYDCHSGQTTWSGTLECASVFFDDGNESSDSDEDFSEDDYAQFSMKKDESDPDYDETTMGARRVLLANELWIVLVSSRRLAMWTWSQLLSASVDDDAAASKPTHPAPKPPVSDSAEFTDNDEIYEVVASGTAPGRTFSLARKEQSLRLQPNLCSIDERGRVLLGARDAFVVYDCRTAMAIYRFRRKNALPLHFLKLQWSGECVVSLEAKGARVFRVLPRVGVASRRFTDNVDFAAETAHETKQLDTFQESRLAPLLTPDGGARFTSVRCTLRAAYLGDSFGRLYVIRLSDEEAAGVDAVAASAVVAGDDDDSYSRGDDSSDDTDRSKGRRRSSVNSRAIAAASPKKELSVSPAYARLMKALRGDKVAQFEKAVATLDDKAALMRLHGAQRQTILHEAAAQGQKSIVLWLLRGYATAIDHVQGDGQSALHYAAAAGQREICRVLLKAGADRRIKDAAGFTAAHCFAGSVWPIDEVEDCDKLLDELLVGIPVDVLAADGTTPLWAACLAGDAAAAFALLDRGADVDQRTPDGSSLLHAAVTATSLQLVHLLIDWGVDLRAETTAQVLARDVAESVGHADMATIIDKQTFLEASQPLSGRRQAGGKRPQPTRVHTVDASEADGAAVRAPPGIKKAGSLAKFARRVRGKSKQNLVDDMVSPRGSPAKSAPSTPDNSGTDDGGSKAALTAAKHSLGALKDVAKKNKSLVFEAVDKHQQTTLHIAAYAGLNDVIEWLLQHKKRPDDFVNRQDKNGWTALHSACSAQHVDAVRTLLANGADPRAVDSKQTTPLHYAVRSSKMLPTLPLLLNGGARVDARDNEGDTPLFKACFKGCVQAVEFLLNNGASLDAFNDDGETCLHFAARGGQVAVVKLLLSNGVSCDVKSSKSGTPRDVAAAFDNEDVVGAIDAHQAALDVKQERRAASKAKPLSHVSSSGKKRRKKKESLNESESDYATSFARSVGASLECMSTPFKTTDTTTPVKHIAIHGDRALCVHAGGQTQLWTTTQRDAKKASATWSTQDEGGDVGVVADDQHGTVMLTRVADKKAETSKVYALSFGDAPLTGEAKETSALFDAHEVVLLVDLDSKQRKKDGAPIWDEHHVCRPWSEFATGKVSPTVIGYSLSDVKQSLSSLGAGAYTSPTSSATDAASTTSDSARTASRTVVFDVLSQSNVAGALGSLLRGALPLDWRSQRVAEAAAAARLAVGGADEDAMPVCAVLSRKEFRFVYTFWKWQQSDLAPAPRHFLLALQEAAGALLATNVAPADSKVESTASSGSSSGVDGSPAPASSSSSSSALPVAKDSGVRKEKRKVKHKKEKN